jgi:predicted DNA-binding protein
MGKMKERPRYNVISMRISDEEKEALEQVTRITSKSVSDLMREAMWLLQGKIDICDRIAR